MFQADSLSIFLIKRPMIPKPDDFAVWIVKSLHCGTK